MNEDNKQLSEELLTKIYTEALNIDLDASTEGTGGKDAKKGNPLLVACEFMKAQNEKELREREMDIREQEIKVAKADQINKAAATGVTAVGILASILCWRHLLKVEGLGGMITTQAGKTLTSGLKIFRLFK